MNRSCLASRRSTRAAPRGGRSTRAAPRRSLHEGVADLFYTDVALNIDGFIGIQRHVNIIRINGVVTVGKPHLVVLEFAPLGALQDYLLGKHGAELTSDMKEHMAHDVASGMEYVTLMTHSDIDDSSTSFFFC